MQRLSDDAATGFLNALCVHFVHFAGAFRVEQLVSTPWASVTFSGARHRVTFTLEGAGAGGAADAFLAGMHEAEFDLPEHILADIALAGEDRAGDRVRLTLEALTVEDV
jgi:hypothetical protein